MKYHVISDTHYDHHAIIEFCDRPANHAELMFASTSAVPEKDCLIHLGDVAMGNDQEVHDKYIKPLKCRKILVLGNHDNKSMSWYMDNGWDFVCNSFRFRYGGKILLFSHIPQVWDGVWELNIHGHLHNLGHRRYASNIVQHWMRLYAPELMDYKPVELTKFVNESIYTGLHERGMDDTGG